MLHGRRVPSKRSQNPDIEELDVSGAKSVNRAFEENQPWALSRNQQFKKVPGIMASSELPCKSSFLSNTSSQVLPSSNMGSQQENELLLEELQSKLLELCAVRIVNWKSQVLLVRCFHSSQWPSGVPAAAAEVMRPAHIPELPGYPPPTRLGRR
jgi:hypothetical protein